MANDLIITVTPSLRIRVGGGTSTIEEETVVKSGSKAGSSKWGPAGYYGSLDAALVALHTKHLDKLTREQILEIGRVRDAIVEGAELLRQVSAVDSSRKPPRPRQRFLSSCSAPKQPRPRSKN
jgi:hypothetical protein